MKELRQPRPPMPLRVLVVDDNRDCADSLAMLLEIIGHRATIVCDAPAAFDAVRDVQPEIVLLDIGMPELDGYELARTLRAQYPRIVLIAVTGWAREEDRIQALQAGCDAH